MEFKYRRSRVNKKNHPRYILTSYSSRQSTFFVASRLAGMRQRPAVVFGAAVCNNHFSRRSFVMRRLAFAALLFVFACGVVAQQPEPRQKTDLELIQGEWHIVGLDSGGKVELEKNYKWNTFLFRKDKDRVVDVAILRESVYGPVEFIVTLDSTKTPKVIDLAVKGNTVHGIYKLDGDDLTLCVSIGGT